MHQNVNPQDPKVTSTFSHFKTAPNFPKLVCVAYNHKIKGTWEGCDSFINIAKPYFTFEIQNPNSFPKLDHKSNSWPSFASKDKKKKKNQDQSQTKRKDL